MSSWIVSRTDIDALVTVALRWTEATLLPDLPQWVGALLTVTPGNASEIGSRLWMANHDANNYGGPREMLDPETLAEIDPTHIAVMPDYEFEALPGFPRPQTAIKRAGYYAYQTAGDYWDRSEWPHGRPPFEMLFHQAMVWTAAGLLDIPRPDGPDVYSPFNTPIEDHVMHDPVTKASGWKLGESDRDLFVRLADL